MPPKAAGGGKAAEDGGAHEEPAFHAANVPPGPGLRTRPVHVSLPGLSSAPQATHARACGVLLLRARIACAAE